MQRGTPSEFVSVFTSFDKSEMGGDWSTGIFGCFSDPGTFCMAICGWPFLVGRSLCQLMTGFVAFLY